jgi:uncharacterized protein (DUF983 family)
MNERAPAASRRSLLAAVFSLRCPVCRAGAAFRGRFRMEPSCSVCGFVFEREAGYWVGALYFNYGVTIVIAFVLWLILELLLGLKWETVVLPALIGFSVLFPVLFFRYSRLLWMVIDVAFDPPQENEFR